MTRARILILGGTGEGFCLATRLHAAAGIDVVTSMAGRTPAPKVPCGGLRRGGFGGPKGLADYLGRERISAVIDATHPFASRMSQNAALAGNATGIPMIHIWRDGWVRQAEDDWCEVDTIEAAAEALPAHAGTTFLTTGKTQLHCFSARDDVAFLARTVAPVSAVGNIGSLPVNLSFVFDKGPFDLESERKLLAEYDVRWIVSKNSGGDAAYAKILAARERCIPVIMVKRPDAPQGLCVANADAALNWLDVTLGLTLSDMSAKEVAT